MEKSQITKRIEYIDIFRALGIIFMVMGHVGFTVYFDHFIHAFHMPMFFFVSGFFFKRKTVQEMSFCSFLKKKMRSLLIPYLFFGIVHFIIYTLLYGFSAEPLLHLVWINTDKLPIAGALWFLTALFFTDVLYFLLDRYLTNKYAKGVVLLLLSLTGCFANLLPFALPFGLGASLASLLIYEMGYLTKTFSEKKVVSFALQLPWYCFLPLAGITAVLIFLNGYINMRIGSYGFVPLFYLNVLLAVLVLLNFAKYLFTLFQTRFPNNYLIGIGRNSIVYLGLNQLFILLFRFLAVQVQLPVGGIGVIASKLFILVGCMVMLYLCEKLFTKTKLKVLIGNK